MKKVLIVEDLAKWINQYLSDLASYEVELVVITGIDQLDLFYEHRQDTFNSQFAAIVVDGFLHSLVLNTADFVRRITDGCYEGYLIANSDRQNGQLMNAGCNLRTTDKLTKYMLPELLIEYLQLQKTPKLVAEPALAA